MKRIFYLIAVSLVLYSTNAFAQFDDYFHDKTLRIDYTHSGDSENEHYFIDKVLEEPYWAGSKTKLIDTFEYGKYFFKVYDKETGKEIYSRGYCTLFGEWQTTEEATKVPKSFKEAIVMPFPKKDVKVEFFTRSFKTGKWVSKLVYDIDVSSYFIQKNKKMNYPSFDVHVKGKSSEKLDIVLLPEGYTKAEMGKFIADCKVFAEKLFSFAPYDKNIDKINIRAILAPSEDSGIDIPAKGEFKNTLLDVTFYTFDSERYCMTDDFQKVRDLAKNAPYDQIYILANTTKYGGGGIYNYYSLSINGNIKAPEVFIHEFGHGFAGLGDEYYTSSTSYNDFYNLKVEPWEPNITTLVDFKSKWKHLVDKKTPIPTPDEKKYYNKTGAFEGGGYVAKKVYRPAHDCLMKSFQGHTFCAACQEAIQKMIDFYTE
ncbi:MAG: M64 family metallopeptidase [Hyphomicrobiales bacterium]